MAIIRHHAHIEQCDRLGECYDLDIWGTIDPGAPLYPEIEDIHLDGWPISESSPESGWVLRNNLEIAAAFGTDWVLQNNLEIGKTLVAAAFGADEDANRWHDEHAADPIPSCDHRGA
jgi:hypothetical protein